MYVVLVVRSGELTVTAIKKSANDAVELAALWHKKFQDKDMPDGFIAIEKQVRGEVDNVRFAEVPLSEGDERVRLYLANKTGEPELKAKCVELTKSFLLSFFEYALVRLSEVLKDKNNSLG